MVMVEIKNRLEQTQLTTTSTPHQDAYSPTVSAGVLLRMRPGWALAPLKDGSNYEMSKGPKAPELCGIFTDIWTICMVFM